MLANPAIRSNIRDGKIFQIPNTMLTNARQGMVLLDQALANLYKAGKISRDSVMAFCNDQDEVNRMMGGGTILQ